MPALNIIWEIPHAKLIQENGVEFCLKYIPGTGMYLTHKKTYGKEEVSKWENVLRK